MKRLIEEPGKSYRVFGLGGFAQNTSRGGVPGKEDRGELKRPRNYLAEDEAPPFGGDRRRRL